MNYLLTALLSLMLPAAAMAKRAALSGKEKAEVLKVLEKNDKLFNAYLKKDSALIEASAKELEKALAASKTPLLKEVRKNGSKLKDIESYEKFLNPLISVVQKYDLGPHYNVFSCPMVNKSWLQDVRVNKGVKNVYAMDMLECGTQDTKF